MDINVMSGFMGILISLGWEQTLYFKDETKPAVNKILIVLASCVAWSLIVWFLTIDQFPTTLLGWRSVLVTAIVTGFSSQAFHQTVNTYFPALGNFAIALRTPAKTSTTVSTSMSAGASFGSTVPATTSSTTSRTVESPAFDARQTPLLGTPLPTVQEQAAPSISFTGTGAVADSSVASEGSFG